MKILRYKKTPENSNILVGITEPRINPLETKSNAVESVKATDRYKEFEAEFKVQKARVEQFQRTGRPLNSPVLMGPLLNLQAMQRDLMVMQKEIEKENPVYLVPASAVLVDAEVAERIEKGLKAGKYIAIELDEGGEFNGTVKVLSGENMGRKYRHRYTAEWKVINFPDETLPDDAVFADPDEEEAQEIRRRYVSGLSDSAKAAEKEVSVKAAEAEFVNECLKADYLGGGDAEATKKQARKELDKKIKDIKKLYS